MSLINKLFGFLQGPNPLQEENDTVKAAKDRLARRKGEVEGITDRDLIRLGKVEGKGIIDAAHSALSQPPISLDPKEEAPLVEGMTPDLFTPWAAYGVWYYWEPGPTGHAWDLRSVGPFDEREQAEADARLKMGDAKFVL